MLIFSIRRFMMPWHLANEIWNSHLWKRVFLSDYCPTERHVELRTSDQHSEIIALIFSHILDRRLDTLGNWISSSTYSRSSTSQKSSTSSISSKSSTSFSSYSSPYKSPTTSVSIHHLEYKWKESWDRIIRWNEFYSIFLIFIASKMDFFIFMPRREVK